MTHLKPLPAIVFLLLVPLFFGCSASKNITDSQTHLQGIEDARAVNIDSLSTFLGKYRMDDEDEVLYQLEYGMLNHYLMDWDESSRYFAAADRAIERQYTKDISKNLKSLLVNDLQLPYEGEAYESIYLSTFSSLNYLHKGDVRGGLVEVRRINHKLELLNDRYKGLANSLMHNEGEKENPKKASMAQMAVQKVDDDLTDIDLLSKDSEHPVEIHQNSALGRFMATVLYAKTGSRDNARIELEQLRTALEDQGGTDFLSAFPDKSALQASVSTTSLGVSTSASDPAPADTSAVKVPDESQFTSQTAYNTLFLAFSGKAPLKKEKRHQFDFVMNGEEVQLNFAVPTLETSGTVVDRVRVIVAGDTLNVPLIEDMQSVATSMFERKLPIIYTRAVMRSFLKAGVTEGAQNIVENQMGGIAGWLTGKVGNATSTALAQADTRGWQTMPGFAYATIADVPAGEHEVIFEYLPAKDAPNTLIHVLKEDGRWIVTTAGPDLIDEVNDLTKIDTYRDLFELTKRKIDAQRGFFHTYPTRQAAIEAGRRIAESYVPSRLIVHGTNESIEETTSFEVYKRRSHQIFVSGKQDLDVAQSIYLH